jgi:Toxin PAAR-like domain
MPATVNANKMALTHAGSTGINTIFPDVCKTPTPGGPVPIPYPNIAMSSDTADGSSTLKADGNPIMLKGSNYKMSTGDEAGSAQGVVSNKIKGKAEPLMYSFDVKVDGKNVFRLTDMMLQNVGSPNTPPGTNVEPPVIGMDPTLEECKKTKEKWEEQKAADTSWGECGIIGDHRDPIQTAADTHTSVLYIRHTKTVCGPWITAKHQPKPHSCMHGTTIKPGDVDAVRNWLDEFFEDQNLPMGEFAELSHSGNAAHKRLYSRTPEYYIGIIGLEVKPGFIQPLTGAGRQTISYSGKWMTGDYDLFEVLKGDEPCKKVKGDAFAQLKRDINKGCTWDAIQHPPQAQWVPNKKEQAEGVKAFDMNKRVAAAISPGGDLNDKIKDWHPKRGDMDVIANPLTVVSGKGVMTLKEKDEVKDALVCQECPG